ncbi:glycosyltransferase family 4 protein [Kocuria sp. M1R5S2]|uniref:glycosyltransferase family 4 protein n=1 Tax=Kocuria rhizosphaerae TaxID=3376285 RepID=UPI00379364C1
MDIQWSHFATLLPVVAILNPRARTVVMVHDVLSQRFARDRKAARTTTARVRYFWAQWQAVAVERFAATHADVVAVLSDKDRALIPGDRVRVLFPPLAADAPEAFRAPEMDCLLFVAAMYRDENREALRWFLREVWPAIRAQRPSVRLDVAGAGPGEELERLVDDTPAVRLLGFVENLDPLYERATSVVVPLRHGAGVKFKVVDALVRGVPVVTTTVGAEGIGESSWFAGVHDDAADFAGAVTRVLRHPDEFERHADVARDSARQVYGLPDFRAAVRRTYGFDPEESR